MVHRPVWILCLLLLAACSGGPAAPVDDPGGRLMARDRHRLEAALKALHQELDMEMLVFVSDKKLDDINGFSDELFERRRLGRHTRGARGLLLVADPAAQKVRLSVGYDLEEVFPDGFLGYLERRQMRSFFLVNRMSDGILAAVELMRDQAQGRLEAGSWQPVPREVNSDDKYMAGGAGVVGDTPRGDLATEKTAAPHREEFDAGLSPGDTLRRYIGSLEQHVKDPQLGIFTGDTRRFLASWVVTDAQQDHEAQVLTAALPQSELFIDNDRAVIRFSVANRRANPYFFLRNSRGGWEMDLSAMTRHIQFNQSNQWHFISAEHPYFYAFSDWLFDEGGYPHPAPENSPAPGVSAP